jgi:hypothetical protein
METSGEGWTTVRGKKVDPYGWSYGSPFPQSVYKSQYEKGNPLPTWGAGPDPQNYGSISGDPNPRTYKAGSPEFEAAKAAQNKSPLRGEDRLAEMARNNPKWGPDGTGIGGLSPWGDGPNNGPPGPGPGPAGGGPAGMQQDFGIGPAKQYDPQSGQNRMAELASKYADKAWGDPTQGQGQAVGGPERTKFGQNSYGGTAESIMAAQAAALRGT